MTGIIKIPGALKKNNDGIWLSEDAGDLSYPPGGSADCYEIEGQSFWFRHRNDCITEVIKRFPPAGPVYDVGGGNGFVSLGLRDRGFDTVLIEPSIQGAINARARGLDPVICSTLEGAGFCKGSIPAIGMFDVLEHIGDDAEFLVKVRSFLAPGGRLYLTVPAYQGLWSYEDKYAGHYRRYSLSTLSRSARLAGFNVEYGTYFFSLLPIPIFVLKSVPGMIGLRKSPPQGGLKGEHVIDSGGVSRLLEVYRRFEVDRLKKGWIRFGSSCLLVARSPAQNGST